MEYTIDNINQWVAELSEKPKITQFLTYAQVVRDEERRNAEKVILHAFVKNDGYHPGAKDVTIINDDMAIITFTSTKNETHYVPIVNGKASYVWFNTFEGALLGAISILKTGNVDAVKYAGKLLEVEM